MAEIRPELQARFGNDADALEWARSHVQAQIDFLREASKLPQAREGFIQIATWCADFIRDTLISNRLGYGAFDARFGAPAAERPCAPQAGDDCGRWPQNERMPTCTNSGPEWYHRQAIREYASALDVPLERLVSLADFNVAVSWWNDRAAGYLVEPAPPTVEPEPSLYSIGLRDPAIPRPWNGPYVGLIGSDAREAALLLTRSRPYPLEAGIELVRRASATEPWEVVFVADGHGGWLGPAMADG